MPNRESQRLCPSGAAHCELARTQMVPQGEPCSTSEGPRAEAAEKRLGALSAAQARFLKGEPVAEKK